MAQNELSAFGSAAQRKMLPLRPKLLALFSSKILPIFWRRGAKNQGMVLCSFGMVAWFSKIGVFCFSVLIFKMFCFRQRGGARLLCDDRTISLIQVVNFQHKDIIVLIVKIITKKQSMISKI